MSHPIGPNGNSQHTSPKRSKKIIVVLSALVLGGVGLAACTDAEDSPRVVGTYTAAPVTTRAAAAPALEGLVANAPGTKTKPKLDPLTADGTWLVPSEIKPGTYKVTATSNLGIDGYWALCADLACKIDGDGSDYTGMIDNDNVSGVGYVVIPAHATAIQHKRVTLEAVR